MSALHIVNGTTITEGLHATAIAGMVAEYADVLHEGPVTRSDDPYAFIRARARVIAQFGWGKEPDVRASFEAVQRHLDDLTNFDDIILWYEHDLFDQLLLIRLLAWWNAHSTARPPMLVSPADYLGSMNTAQLQAAFDARERVTDVQMQLAARAWNAFTADDPTALVQLVRHENTAALPHLEGALQRMIEEYPSSFNGVGRTEQQVLDILAQSPLSALDLFAANARREERVFMGDSTFFMRVARLLGRRQPLVQGSLDSGVLKLTDAGQSVQEGATDDVALNGIDRWIGGVHLRAGNVWRWNGMELRTTAH